MLNLEEANDRVQLLEEYAATNPRGTGTRTTPPAKGTVIEPAKAQAAPTGELFGLARAITANQRKQRGGT